MAHLSILVCLVLVLLYFDESLSVNECRAKTYEEPGDVKFSLIVSMRGNTGDGTCGDVTYGSLQYLLAVKYVLQKLNTADKDGNTFVPGLKLGFEVYDDCGNEEYATAHAMEFIRGNFPNNIIQCSSNSNASVFAGFIGPSRSQSTTAVSGVLQNTRIPLVTMGATLSELSNKTEYPNVIRTSVSDSMQSRAIVSLLEELRWTVVAIVHTADNYGTDLSKTIQEQVRNKQICITYVGKVTTQAKNLEDVLKNLLEKQEQTVGQSMGVIYAGHWDVAKQLISSVRALSSFQPKAKNLKWIMTDGVGSNSDVMAEFGGFVLTISPASEQLLEFGTFVQSEVNGAKRNSSNVTIPWLADYVKKSCQSESFPGRGCNEFIQDDYAVATINAAYALSTAVKTAHLRICKGASGVCPAFASEQTLDLLADIRNVSLLYASLHETHSIQQFSEINKYLVFDADGDLVQEEGKNLYSINKYQTGIFHQVGLANRNGTQLNSDFKQLDHQSGCSQVCETCVEKPSYIYLHGEILLAGFLSMHWAPTIDNPFGCGDFRAEVHTVIAVEAFLYMVKKMKKDTGKDIGAVIFDDCYSNLKADLIISKYFSGEIPLMDPKTGDVIDLSNVVAVIGSESSSVSLPLAESFTRLRLPVISPASTTPDLDDRGLYPYFMRTVPSDKGTGDVMIAIAQHFGWKYINIVHVRNNYGYKAMLKVQEKAIEEGICVADPISLEVSPVEKDMIAIIKRLSQNGARVVIFIGIEGGTIKFQNVLSKNAIDLVFLAAEDWAVTLKHVPGTERAVEGSLVFMSDPPRNPTNDFPDYMHERIPNVKEKSFWFDRFWQKHFECNLPGRFENVYNKVCDLNTQRFDIATGESWLKQFRVGNTINAVASVISGVIKARDALCRNDVFACETYKEHPNEVASFIRNITLDTGFQKFRPFRDDGNGNIGTGIFNLQRGPDGGHAYIKVGSYDSVENKLTMIADRSVFYSNGRTVKDVKAVCTVEKICQICPKTAAAAQMSTEQCIPGSSTEVIILILVCILCILVIIVLVIVACLLCHRCRTTENSGRGIQKTETQMNGTTMTDQMRGHTTPAFQNQPPSYSSSETSQVNPSAENNSGATVAPPVRNKYPSNQVINPQTVPLVSMGDHETKAIPVGGPPPLPPSRFRQMGDKSPDRLITENTDISMRVPYRHTPNPLWESNQTDPDYPHQPYPDTPGNLHQVYPSTVGVDHQTSVKDVDTDLQASFLSGMSNPHGTSVKTINDPHQTEIKTTARRLDIGDSISSYDNANLGAIPPRQQRDDLRYAPFPKNDDYLTATALQNARRQGNTHAAPGLSQERSMDLPLQHKATVPVDVYQYSEGEV